MNQEIQNCENFPFNLFTEIKELGKGAFGTVKLYRYEPTGELQAIKLLRVSEAEFIKEVLPFLNLRHENLLYYYGLTKIAVFRGIVLEFMAGGSLEDVLHPKNRAPFEYTLKDVLNWNIQSARALEYMHNLNGVDENNKSVYPRYIHRDIKPANMLLDGTYQTLKLGDFGFTKKIDSSRNTFVKGTPLYMAPEVLFSQNYNETADVYSWTLTFWECLTGKIPFVDCRSMTQLKDRKKQQNHLANVDTAFDKFNKIIQCGSKLDRNRPSMSSWRKLLETLYNNNDFEQKETQANTICVWNDEHKEFFYCHGLEEFDWAAFDRNLSVKGQVQSPSLDDKHTNVSFQGKEEKKKEEEQEMVVETEQPVSSTDQQAAERASRKESIKQEKTIQENIHERRMSINSDTVDPDDESLTSEKQSLSATDSTIKLGDLLDNTEETVQEDTSELPKTVPFSAATKTKPRLWNTE